MYQIKLLPSAQRDLDDLPFTEFSRISARLKRLNHEPRPYGSVKLTGEEGYRLRIGHYRLLYRIADREKTVYVYRVKHRREVYR